MKRPNFQPLFDEKSEFCEVCVSKPVETFVPKQAISISELVSRFERGQRLNVHSNFAPGSNFDMITENEAIRRMAAEDMDSDDFPPTGVHDVSDVEAHYRAHQEHKTDFQSRMKKKKEESMKKTPQAQPMQAQQVETTPPQPVPPAPSER